MNRKSISASFNSKEIEAIDRVCAKLGITRGRLIKEAVTSWMINKPFETFIKKYPRAAELNFAAEKVMEKTSKRDEEKKVVSRLSRYDKSFLVEGVYELERALLEFEDQHVAYHELAKKKKIGAPKKPKKKPGRPKDKGR